MVNKCIICGRDIYRGKNGAMYCTQHKTRNTLACGVTDSEYQQVKERIKKDNITKNAFLRMCIRKELNLVD